MLHSSTRAQEPERALALDSERSALAATAATTLVALLATDRWEKIRVGLGALWRTAHPERADTIEAELIEARGELVAAGTVYDQRIKRKLVDEWESRLIDCWTSIPELAVQLRQLLDDDLIPAIPVTGVGIMNRTLSGVIHQLAFILIIEG